MHTEYVLLASFSIGVALFAISHIAKQFIPSRSKKAFDPPKITIEKFDVNELCKPVTDYINEQLCKPVSECVNERWHRPTDDECGRIPVRPPKPFVKPEKLNFFVPRDGIQNIVILPAADLKSPFFITRKQHYLNPNGAAIMCPKRVSEETKDLHHENQKWIGDCPICNQNQKLWAASSAYQNCYRNAQVVDPKDMEQKARRCKGMKRFYYNISVLSFEPDEGTVCFSDPMIWSVGIMVHNELQRYLSKDDRNSDEFVNVNDINKFSVLKLQKTVRHIYPQYDTYLRPLSSKYKQSALSDNWPRLKEKLWDLEKVSQGWEKSDFELALAVRTANVDVTVIDNTEQMKGRAARPPIDEQQSLADEDFLAALKRA